MLWARGGASWAANHQAGGVLLYSIFGGCWGQEQGREPLVESCPHGKDKKTQRGQVLIHRLWSEWVALLGADSMP